MGKTLKQGTPRLVDRQRSCKGLLRNVSETR